MLRSRRRPTRLATLLIAGAVASCQCGPKLRTGNPSIKVDGTTIDFGLVPVDNVKTLPSCKTCTDGVVVHSLGPADLTINSLTISPAGSAFSVDPLEGGLLVLSSGEQRGILVHFNPPAEQTFTATLTIGSDDPQNATVTVNLTGQGHTHACIGADAAVNFGLICESVGAVQKLTITAGCTADLILTSIGFESGGSSAFSFIGSTTTPTTVPMGQQMYLTVAFQPKPGGPAAHTAVIDIGSTDPAQPVIKVPVSANVNFAPTPKINAPPNVAQGQTLTLDGSGSTDPDNNNPLTCSWTLALKPFASSAAVNPQAGMSTQITFDLPGKYTVQLGCTDALGCASVTPASADILSEPAEKLLVELVWDNVITDMDVHFMAPTTTFYSPMDCWWGNSSPDFGIQGFAGDNPTCGPDVLEGFGPEYARYANPYPSTAGITATYTVGAVFYKANGAADPTTNATVRIFEFGLETAEFTQKLTTPGQKWTACTVDWPSGAVTAVGTVQ